MDKTDSSTTALIPETCPACILMYQPALGFSSTPCPVQQLQVPHIYKNDPLCDVTENYHSRNVH
ncbi:hypothetical protein RLOC_00014014 [Lonchura striata]|uniref:Uncharacterized protein n=1 Tax=Lonchura striata TaxID=40157 RepID=A0A218VC82_9PASE|nr:hypothetical protein RLOC_00014014 [Lonchura striata domestica]